MPELSYQPRNKSEPPKNNNSNLNEIKHLITLKPLRLHSSELSKRRISSSNNCRQNRTYALSPKKTLPLSKKVIENSVKNTLLAHLNSLSSNAHSTRRARKFV